MASIQPFRAWRPRPDVAPRVAAPPYDVLNSEEARALARGNEISFLHVSKPEIDFPPSVDVYSDVIYAAGAANLKRLIDRGVMIRESVPALYVYQQRMGDHVQTGIVAGASVDEYESGKIRKHEHTRPDKEDDRARHTATLRANSGPVFLAHPAHLAIDRLVAEIRATQPVYDFVSDDSIGHTVWTVTDATRIAAIRAAFSGMDFLYVADGHHRSAAALRVRDQMRAANPNHRGDEPYNYFLSVIFPHNQLRIMAYNRVVKDLNGATPDDFRNRIRERFEIVEPAPAEPDGRHRFGMYLEGRWARLIAKPGTFPVDHPVESLDAAILQRNLLHPILGIEDPRRDKRIDFVGGIRGTVELERRCREDWAVAFAMYPTSMEELMAVADAGDVMPPKSTWFEPKLRSGLIVRPLDE